VDEMLRSILEMDKRSRIQAEETEKEKIKAFDELSRIRTTLIEKKLADAKTTVDRFREKELAGCAKKAAAQKQVNEALQDKLNSVYLQKHEQWVEEIYNQVIE
jgi:hypothetical protein